VKPIQIENHRIGPGESTFVIAEIGVNHDGSVDRALELVQVASRCGADAVKMQIFRAEALMNRTSRFAEYQQSRVDAASPIEMLRQYELSDAEFGVVVSEIRRAGMVPLATPFSPSDLPLVQLLRFPAVKIASPDLVNHMLLEGAARLAKPLIISTGAATMEEVSISAKWLRNWRVPFAFLHCVSSYPTPVEQANLCWINELASIGAPVGYSDHTTEMLTGALSVTAGACIVEKHLTYDRMAQGPDHSASADPVQFASYVSMIRTAERLRGNGVKRVLESEQDVRQVSRQSLVLSRTLEPGMPITRDALIVQRPGTGIPPAQLRVTIGKQVRQTVQAGTILQWEMLADAA
jgi:sialic acid synthase SpsE